MVVSYIKSFNLSDGCFGSYGKLLAQPSGG